MGRHGLSGGKASLLAPEGVGSSDRPTFPFWERGSRSTTRKGKGGCRPPMRNGGRHRCQPPLSGVAPAASSGSSRSASLAISGPQNDASRCPPEQSGDGLVGPLSGAGRTWKALHHPVRASAEAVAVIRRWTAFPFRSGLLQLVGIGAFRDQSIGPLPRRSAPFFSGWSCNHPSVPGGPTSLSSDDWKLTRSLLAANKKCAENCRTCG